MVSVRSFFKPKDGLPSSKQSLSSSLSSEVVALSWYVSGISMLLEFEI